MDEKQGLVDDDAKLTLGAKLRAYFLYSRTAQLIYLAVLCIALGLLLPIWFLAYYPLDVQQPVYTRGSCMISPQYRFPCLVGQENVTDEECAKAGCCWYDEGTGDGPDQPATCFHSVPASYTYKLNDSKYDDVSLEASLTAYSFSNAANGTEPCTPFGNPEIPRVVASASCPEEDHAVIDIGPPKPSESTHDSHIIQLDGQLSIVSNLGDDWDFYVVVTRNSSGQSLLDMRLGPLIISDLYTEFTILPASRAVYGLGQAFHPTLQRSFDSPVRTTLFSRSATFSEGFHPFYMCIEPDGQVHGVYLETWGPVEVQLLPGPSITLRLLDGRVRLHVFAGPSAAEVSQQYTGLVGRPRLPPYWSLGFHLCRQGDIDSFQSVFQEMVARNISFESDCIDADAFVPFGFKVSPEIESAFLEGVANLTQEQRRLVVYTVPQLPLHTEPGGDAAYPPYQQADQAGLLIRARTGNDSYGNFYGQLHQVWGNKTWNVSYIDYTNPKAAEWLDLQYNATLDQYPIAGLYLMDNAPTDDDTEDDRCEEDVFPFTPNLGTSHRLYNGTVCMSALHNNAVHHLAVHSRYGQDQTRAVRQALGPGPFLSSTSTAAGSGRLGAQLAPDLTADWTSLRLALVQTLELGLYGIPQNGYPACGSLNSSNIPMEDADRLEALCLHWYQLLPYLPLAFSFYKTDHMARNPPHFSSSFVNQASVHISQRYAFVPHYYSLFVEASVTGVPPLRPLWYEFSEDNATWTLDGQLMLGSALMVAPALQENQQLMSLYLPGECWYEYFQGQRAKQTLGPAWVTLPVPAQQTMVYQRASTVIFNQEPFPTLALQRQGSDYSATVALSCGNQSAQGVLYLPGADGDDVSAGQSVLLTASNTSLTVLSRLDDPFCKLYNSRGYRSGLQQVKLYGLPQAVSNASVLLTDRSGGQQKLPLQVNYNSRPPVLILMDLPIDWCLHTSADISWQ